MLQRIVAAVRRILRIRRRVELTSGISREVPRPMKRLRFYWHIHHDAVVEPLLNPLEQRRRYIREDKPEPERELRLRLIKPVKGKLPKGVIRAGRDMLKVYSRTETAMADHGSGSGYDAYQRAFSDYMRYYIAYRFILREHRAEVDALHQAECPDCPWDGRTIFPKEGD